MRIFQDISSRYGDKTIQEAITAIVERAQELHLLSRKWSLAELQLDNDDFAWLSDWAYGLSGKAVQLWLEERPWHTLPIGNRECTYSTALGTLLLLFCQVPKKLALPHLSCSAIVLIHQETNAERH